MAKRDSDTAVLDRSDTPEGAPVMLIGLGRGQTGKSCFTRWAIDRARSGGRQVIAADGDRSNATLTSYYKDAARPASADDGDVHVWLTELVEELATDRVSVALDLGGGDRTMEAYAREFPLAEFCTEYGIRLVYAYFVAPNVDSLAPIVTLEQSGVLRATNTILVLNEGLVPLGVAPDVAFNSVKEHPAFRDILSHAELVIMPKLGGMADLETRRLGFYADQTSLGPMNAFRVKHWLKQMDEAFAPVRSWLP